MAGYAKSLERYRTEIVGRHSVRMPDGMEACRKGDCFSGLLTADAFLEYGRKQGARLALVNGGAIRASLPAGDISRGDLLALHPFDGQVYVREYSGKQIMDALEHAVSGPDGEGPQLLQVAGGHQPPCRPASAGRPYRGRTRSAACARSSGPLWCGPERFSGVRRRRFRDVAARPSAGHQPLVRQGADGRLHPASFPADGTTRGTYHP